MNYLNEGLIKNNTIKCFMIIKVISILYYIKIAKVFVKINLSNIELI